MAIEKDRLQLIAGAGGGTIIGTTPRKPTIEIAQAANVRIVGFEAAAGGLITGGNGGGILVHRSSSARLENNSIINNGGQSGLSVRIVSRVFIRDSGIKGNSPPGILVQGNSSIELLDNSISENANSGFLTSGSSFTLAAGNVISGNGSSGTTLNISEPQLGSVNDPGFSAANTIENNGSRGISCDAFSRIRVLVTQTFNGNVFGTTNAPNSQCVRSGTAPATFP